MEIDLICSDPSGEKLSREYPGLAKAIRVWSDFERRQI